MAETSVKVQGLSKVQRMLNKADANSALIVGLSFGIKELEQKASKYAPVSEANRPNESGRWYERGYGTRYIRSDGSTGGRLTSYPLKDGWQRKLFRGADPRGEVWNDAPYAVYVQGPRNTKPGQAQIHGRRGWLRLDEEGKKLAPEITKKVIKAFKERMK